MLLPLALPEDSLGSAKGQGVKGMHHPAGSHSEILEWLTHLVGHHPMGAFPGEPSRRLFEAPLLGVAWGGDTLFGALRRIIGPFHRLPLEVLQTAFPGESFPEEMVWVVCYVLPIERTARLANRRQRRFPHPDWMLTKIHGEGFNEWLRAQLVGWIRERGHRAVAPVLHPSFLQFPLLNGEITSNWSERHACFAAGMGTFGLSRGLITQAGMAVRVGTVVTDLPLVPTSRAYSSPHEHCLFLSRGECGRCMERCPAGAITLQGQDKRSCQEHQMASLRRRGRSLGLGRQITGLHLSCGLCQTGVPCEDRVPGVKARVKSTSA